MGYIGNQTSNSYSSFDKQDLTGVTGSPAKRGFTLSHAVANAQEIEVFVNNVRQEPGEAYTVSGTGLTMTGDVETTDDFYVVFQGKALQTTVPPDDSVTTARINDGAVTSAKLASGAAQAPVSVAVLSHVTAFDTGGGDLTSGAYRTRPLNTEVDPDSIVTLSSNQFTLVAGTYTIDWTCDAYKVDHHWSQIYDITNSATLILGSASYAGSTENVGDVSYGHHIFTITSTTTYELQQQSTTTKTTNGMGIRTNVSGNNSIHAYLKITKLA